MAGLPTELHEHVLRSISDEDDLAALGATNRYWRRLARAHLHPGRAVGLSPIEAVCCNKKHALGRALGWPKDTTAAATQERDEDGMTLLMHAARLGHRAMVRCLVKHHRGVLLNQRDKAHMSARQWAELEGVREAFEHDAGVDARGVRGALRLQEGPKRRIDLHHAVTSGHQRLAQRLRMPHFARLRAEDPGATRVPGADMQMPLSCQKTPLLCALHHAPPHKPMFLDLWRHLGHTVPDPAAATALAQQMTLHKSDWVASLEPLYLLGFDPHRIGRNGQSYYTTWLREIFCSVADATQLHKLCGGIIADTPAGKALLERCMQLGKPELLPLVTDLVRCGVHSAAVPDVQMALLQRTVARIGCSQALWRLFFERGVRLDDTDTQGQTLAHFAILNECHKTRVRALGCLIDLGLDVEQVCHEGINPVVRLLCTQDPSWEDLERLAAFGVRFERPGRVSSVHQGTFDAQTALEAALFVEDRDVAEWLVKEGVCPSVKQLCEMAKRLDAASTAWPKAWLYKVIARRTFGMRGAYLVHTNLAGGWHARLSRTHLQDAQRRHTAAALQETVPKKRFWRAVHASAIDGAVFARRAARPLTLAVDACLGTQKDEDALGLRGPWQRMAAAADGVYNEARTSGIVGNAAGAVSGLTIIGVGTGTSLVLAPLLWPVDYARGRSMCAATSQAVAVTVALTEWGLDVVLFGTATQIAAAAGCIPKVLLSAGGYAGGAVWGASQQVARLSKRNHPARRDSFGLLRA